MGTPTGVRPTTMSPFAVLLLVVPLVLATPPTPEERIVNGHDVDIADFPWQGSYRPASGSHSCGCVFVGGSSVITAGHCGGTTRHTMEFGSSVRGKGQVYGVAMALRHPQYGVGQGFTPHDFTVVKSRAPISGENIKAGKLAQDGTNPMGDVWLTGWGRTCGFCGIPTHLKGFNPPLISDRACLQKMGRSFNSELMICAYNGHSSSCNGDSGGPMSQGDTILGVTSWGRGGCPVSAASVYAKVGAVRSWICKELDYEPRGC